MDRTHLTGRLDTRVPPVVRFENAVLDDNPTSPEGIVLRGRVALSSLRFIKTDWYQRELELSFARTSRRGIVPARRCRISTWGFAVRISSLTAATARSSRPATSSTDGSASATRCGSSTVSATSTSGSAPWCISTPRPSGNMRASRR